MLRARYFPDGKLLNARPKKGSSFTWQSILVGLDCFKRGCIWRVGDGTQINIRNDSWIPTSHNLKVQTIRGQRLVTTVNELISPIDGRWDEQLIRDIFWEIDAERILKIPLHNGREDLVAWHFNRSGIFSVRSAYHKQWEHKYGGRPETIQAGGSAHAKVWKDLWKLKVPNKIKIFGWRALRGFIPGRGILANRHIGNTSSCPVCNSGCEDIKHILFACEKARAVWQCLGMWERVQNAMIEERSGSVVLEEIIRRNEALPQMDVNFAELILTGGWYLWWERRQQVHGERTQPIARSAVSIMVLTLNYMKAMKKQPQIKDGWKKPREDYVKVNVDASFDENTGTGSTGVVIRDHTGGAIAMSQRYLPYVDDAPMAEAYGLLDGLRLAEGVGCNRVIVNSDCVEVVNTMKDDGFSATSAAAIYDDCVVIWKGFSDISIDHCNRDANKVAHELAFNSFSNKSSCIWADEPPSFILATLANDVIMFDDQ